MREQAIENQWVLTKSWRNDTEDPIGWVISIFFSMIFLAANKRLARSMSFGKRSVMSDIRHLSSLWKADLEKSKQNTKAHRRYDSRISLWVNLRSIDWLFISKRPSNHNSSLSKLASKSLRADRAKTPASPSPGLFF
jgi:hypothetical protein